MTDDTTKDEKNEDREEKPSRVKVTDKRIFGPDGELREEYSFLQQEGKPEAEETTQTAPETSPENLRETPLEPPTPERAPEAAGGAAKEAPGPRPSPGAGAPPGAAAGGGPGEEPGPFGQPSFLDLVSILAEPVAVYLGDVKLPDGRKAENLNMARFHIDLLDVLREKTEGRLTDQEHAVLDDLLYRLRMRFVQKRDAERSGLEQRSNIETPG